MAQWQELQQIALVLWLCPHAARLRCRNERQHGLLLHAYRAPCDAEATRAVDSNAASLRSA